MQSDVERVKKMKQRVSLIVGIILFVASWVFSNKGFGDEMGTSEFAWVGWALSAAVFIQELIFNGQLAYREKNMTLFWLGILAYCYGIGTNVIGFWSVQKLSYSSFESIMTLKHLFGTVFGLILEIAPEPMIIYGLIGISNQEGDFLGSLLHNWDDVKSHVTGGGGSNNNRNSQPQRELRPENHFQPTQNFSPQRTMQAQGQNLSRGERAKAEHEKKNGKNGIPTSTITPPHYKHIVDSNGRMSLEETDWENPSETYR